MEPPTILVRRIENPTPEEIDEAVALSVRAYAGDISEKVFTNGDATRADLLWRGLIRAGAHSGELYAAAPADDDTPGAMRALAVWFPPGQLVYSTPEQRALGFTELIEGLEPAYRAWLLDDFSAKSRALKARIFGPEMERCTMYASHIATDPAYQRRGLASALIRHVLADAARSGAVVALGTQHERNAAFYRGLGFVEQGRLDGETPWGLFTGNFFIHGSCLAKEEQDAA
ncbi:hypothetical protein BC834DRAFT_1043499 [Gloeopeniophorella convolvens]|nr:hypothetical protein BC834DRAFT_1043499 [Gloeopeniophorella convolvens]